MNSAKKIHSLTGCVYGSVDDPTGALYDSRDTKRATAINRTASEYGVDFKEVKCRTIYARWIEPIEVWEEHEGGQRYVENWLDDNGWDAKYGPNYGQPGNTKWTIPEDSPPCPFERDAEGDFVVPKIPPEGWSPDEYDPAWTMCEKSEEGSVKCYLCEVEL